MTNAIEISDVFSNMSLIPPGAGFEGVDMASDVAIPYLRILQALSGEIKRGSRHVEGAKEGDIFLSSVGVVYPGDTGVYVVPCAFRKVYIERLMGVTGPSSFVAMSSYEAFSTTRRSNDSKYDVLPNGNHITVAANHFVIVADEDGGNYRAVISMASTQRKKSRQWLAAMGSLKVSSGGVWTTPPSFAYKYLLTTGEEPNDAGTWSGWVIGKPVQITDQQLASAAYMFYKDVSSKPVSVGTEKETEFESEGNF